MKTGFLADLILSHPSSSTLETELRIVVHRPGSVGPMPTIAVKQAGRGIDWDNGSYLLYPENALTELSPEDVEAIRESVKKGQSWHAYQSYKKQYERIKELEAEVATLRKAIDKAKDPEPPPSLNQLEKNEPWNDLDRFKHRTACRHFHDGRRVWHDR